MSTHNAAKGFFRMLLSATLTSADLDERFALTKKNFHDKACLPLLVQPLLLRILSPPFSVVVPPLKLNFLSPPSLLKMLNKDFYCV